MKRVQRLILFLLFITPFSTLVAQGLSFKDKEAIKVFSNETSQLLLDNEVTDAFKPLYLYSLMADNELQALETKTLQTFNMISSTFGTPRSFFVHKAEEIGGYFYRETHILLFKNAALTVEYAYYKGDEGWRVYGFKWNSDLSSAWQTIDK